MPQITVHAASFAIRADERSSLHKWPLQQSGISKSAPEPGSTADPKTFRLLIFLLPVVTAIFVASAVLLMGITEPEFLSPIPDHPPVLSTAVPFSQNHKEIIGFFPFWNLKEEENQRYRLLTQVAFFALQIDEEGNIKRYNDDRTEEPGWTAYKGQVFGALQRKAKEENTKVIVTIQAMDAQVIEQVINDSNHRKRVIDETLGIIAQKNLDGVNIDFEYPGTPTFETSKNFTLFIKEWREAIALHNPSLSLSVDVYADAVAKVRLWDIPEIAQHVNHIIIMAYDFHRASSQRAGPIAPMRGAPHDWEYDLTKMLRDFSKVVELNKIMLGVAYYGYEWRTSSREAYAATYPGSGATASYDRIQELKEKYHVDYHWDETSLSPWLTFNDNGEIHQIYYENDISLGLKYDLVNESGLAGIAIWALGYDGSHPNLWNIISEKFP